MGNSCINISRCACLSTQIGKVTTAALTSMFINLHRNSSILEGTGSMRCIDQVLQ